jgi:aminopeptidase N
MLEIGSYSAPHWKVNEAISYHKEALIMLELEAKISLDAMKKALAAFTERRKGKPSSWRHLLEAFEGVCGDEASSWLREQLST